jgi:hypothetical protein
MMPKAVSDRRISPKVYVSIDRLRTRYRIVESPALVSNTEQVAS